MFKYVLIDIDNTLLDFNKCAEKAMTNACKACGEVLLGSSQTAPD